MSAQFEISNGGHVAIFCGPTKDDQRLVGLQVDGPLGLPQPIASVKLTRDEAREIALELLSRASITSTPTLIRCIGCGLPLGSATEAPSQGAIDHAFTCEKHPIAIALQKTRNCLAAWIRATVEARDRGTLDETARADFNAALVLARTL